MNEKEGEHTRRRKEKYINATEGNVRGQKKEKMLISNEKDGAKNTRICTSVSPI